MIVYRHCSSTDQAFRTLRGLGVLTTDNNLT